MTGKKIVVGIDCLENSKKESKTIQEIIEEDRSIKITVSPTIGLTDCNFKSGKEKRRDRRKSQRINKPTTKQ